MLLISFVIIQYLHIYLDLYLIEPCDVDERRALYHKQTLADEGQTSWSGKAMHDHFALEQ